MNDNTSYERYSRQLALKELGEAGQRKLSVAKVLMIGAGGLGCAALQYLAAAGVGTIGIIDDDIVTLSNLHRQPLYSMTDIGLPKAIQAAAVLRKLNPAIIIDAFNERLTVANAFEFIRRYDVIIDGTDNFSSRYMINDACVMNGKHLVYGAVSKFEGQVAIFNVLMDGTRTANYRDLFPQPPAAGEIANCEETGVLGVLPAIIGAMQASETIKLITGIGEVLTNKLFTYNALNNQTFVLELTAGKDTRNLIPPRAEDFLQTDYDWLCGTGTTSFEINTETFNHLRKQPSVLVADVREPGEIPVVSGFAHIHVPLGSVADNFPDTADETIILFCQSGKRSALAAKLLYGKFGDTKKILSLAGGILKWQQDQLSLK